MSVTNEEDSREEATEDATEQQQQDAPTAADDKWIHSAAKKSSHSSEVVEDLCEEDWKIAWSEGKEATSLILVCRLFLLTVVVAF